MFKRLKIIVNLPQALCIIASAVQNGEFSDLVGFVLKRQYTTTEVG